MLFKKRQSSPPEPILDSSLSEDDIAQSTRVDHKGYTIMAMPRQLHNGNWIVRVVLEEGRPEGPRRYDFAGPMAEYPSEQEARDAGIEHATKRLDE